MWGTNVSRANWVGNVVPVLDTTAPSGNDPAIVVVYCHSKQDVFVTRSLTLGSTWSTARNITASVSKPGWNRNLYSYCTPRPRAVKRASRFPYTLKGPGSKPVLYGAVFCGRAPA